MAQPPGKTRGGRDAADDSEAFDADVENADLDLDPGGVNLDTEEAEDISDAAAWLATADGDIDDETREDLGVDSIVGPLEAGVGGGLDEQEEAQLGITDEEIAAKAEEIARHARRR
ncbi:MAG TPA: hypothetical protein VF339_01570 [Gammaproteobacteria bacterium]